MGADSTRPGPLVRNGSGRASTGAVRCGVLGPLVIVRDGEAVELGGRRLRTLAVLLILAEGDVVPIDTLMAGVWGDRPPNQADNALQALVSRMRAILGKDMVEAVSGGYRLALHAEDVDAVRFERLVAEGRTALASGDAAEAAGLLREALALWRGPALADAADAVAVQPTITRLEAARIAATEERVEADLQLGGAGELVTELSGLIAEHPLRERLRGQLMRALAADGRPAEALSAYEETRKALAAELGADPSPDLAAIHLRILQADGELQTNLRPPATSFIGREGQLEQVRELLRDARLVTLTGPGGAGKTRLAVETTAGHHETAPDGVWLVELAHLTDVAEVVHAVLNALGVRDGGRMRMTPVLADPFERLEAALNGRQMLIILDNCEHLISAAAELAERMVTANPRIRILATSREPLGIAGEQLWPVPPLDIDASRRLFADRAGAVRPGEPTGDPAAVDRICRELDGLPLAIELAAARMRVLSAEQIADRLDDRFRLLTGGSRTALPRHQTLRAVVEWSWDLLDERERMLARRFAVFGGGAPLGAVEAVCGADPLDAVTGLVEKSFLVATGTNPVRYNMLETIRAYALERLSEAGEEDVVRRAHALHWLGFAETGDPILRTADQLHWLTAFNTEHDNMLGALRWSLVEGEANLAVRMTAALGWYWTLRWSQADALQVMREVIELAERRAAESPPPGLGAVYTLYGLMSVGGAVAFDDVRRRLERAVRHRSEAGRFHPLEMWAEPMLMSLGGTGSVKRAEEFMGRHLTDPDPWVSAGSLLFRGMLRKGLGRPREAEQDIRAGVEAFRRLGERWGMEFGLQALGSVLSMRGELRAARAALEEARRLAQELGCEDDIAQAAMTSATILARSGDEASAELALTVAERHCHGDPGLLGFLAVTFGDVARTFGRLDAAERHYRRAAKYSDRSWNRIPPAEAGRRDALGFLAAQRDDAERARRLHTEALDIAAEYEEATLIARAVTGLAGVALLDGETPRSAVLLGGAAAIRGLPDPADFDVARIRRSAVAELGEERFSRAYDQGAAMAREEVLRLCGAAPGAPAGRR